jgi:predicted nucleic acid-binding protein
MSSAEMIVLDSSVGVKWLKPEDGRDTALGLLRLHRDGAVQIFVAEHFMHEVVGVAVRHGGPMLGRSAWRNLMSAGLSRIGLDDRLAECALAQCETLGCSFYDALAPAIAAELHATLWSADARAHRRYEGVQLI